MSSTLQTKREKVPTSRCFPAQDLGVLTTFPAGESSEEPDVPGNTYGHGVVQGVVVDTGSQGVIQHTALKQLQGLRHFFMEIFRGFVGAGEVQIIGVQPVGGKTWQ